MEILENFESSIIGKMWYNEGKQALIVGFKNNKTRTYIYYHVPLEEWNNIIKTESKGKYFNQNIKTKYKHEKIERGWDEI